MKIVEVHDEMIDDVKSFLADRDGFRDSNNWEGLFNYPWKSQRYPYGYAILDENRIVAFIGTIFSERQIDGQNRICCNISTWFVEEEYRPRMLGILLLNPILKINDLMITALTSSQISQGLLARMGFRALDQTQVVVPILPAIPWGADNGKKPFITFDKGKIELHLDEENRKIFKDHATLKCKHFLIKEAHADQFCYGIATSSQIQRLRFLKGQSLNLCYVSDHGVFLRNFRFLRASLLSNKFFLLRYDARLLPTLLTNLSLKKSKERQYKATETAQQAMDNLYSELVTFNKY